MEMLLWPDAIDGNGVISRSIIDNMILFMNYIHILFIFHAPVVDLFNNM